MKATQEGEEIEKKEKENESVQMCLSALKPGTFYVGLVALARECALKNLFAQLLILLLSRGPS